VRRGMLSIAIMIEGQNGLTWPRWQRISRAVEDCGFDGLYRSDHFTTPEPPDLDSLELWVSLTWLASHTRRLAFGPLVSPVSFRDPAMTARMAIAVDDLSGGRLRLGLGAGWSAREHRTFGFDLLEPPSRARRFEEGLHVIRSLLHSDHPVSFIGDFYQLREAVVLPKPQRSDGPPIIVGGNGRRRTLPLAARYADEWNALHVSPATFAALNGELDALLRAAGRDSSEVQRSLLTEAVFGRDTLEVDRRRGHRTESDLRGQGIPFGSAEEIVDQLRAFEQVGVQRVILQWPDLDDLAGLEAMARGVLHHFHVPS
jgi:F420-dependent oxidoreductase-like protein